MAHRLRTEVVVPILYYLGLGTLVAGAIPHLRRRGSPTDLVLLIAGALAITLGIVIAWRQGRGHGPGR